MPHCWLAGGRCRRRSTGQTPNGFNETRRAEESLNERYRTHPRTGGPAPRGLVFRTRRWHSPSVLTRLPNNDVQMSIRPPLVYLDHCAVRVISRTPERCDHLLKTFESRGTLMFSLMNIVEMATNSGESYVQIRDLLDGIGRFWLLSDLDPRTV